MGHRKLAEKTTDNNERFKRSAICSFLLYEQYFQKNLFRKNRPRLVLDISNRSLHEWRIIIVPGFPCPVWAQVGRGGARCERARAC